MARDAASRLAVAGMTSGDFGTAEPNASSLGLQDALVAQYDASGVERWAVRFGSNGNDALYGVATDPSNRIYAVGHTQGDVPGAGPALGGQDALVAVFDEFGTIEWIEQFGTNNADVAVDVAVDAGGRSFVTGRTFGALTTTPHAGGFDVFVSTRDSSGGLLWTTQFGTIREDRPLAVARSGGSLFVVGWTKGQLGDDVAVQPDGHDGFIAKLDASTGTVAWVTQYEHDGDDEIVDVAASSTGEIYVSGWTAGNFGTPHAGGRDPFVARVDPSDGTRLWITQFGSAGDDEAAALAVSNDGSTLYVGGLTTGDFYGGLVGGKDQFMASFDTATGQMSTLGVQDGTSSDDDIRAVTIVGDHLVALGGTHGEFEPGVSNIDGEQDLVLTALCP